jgi:hypothetical protein
MADETPSLHVDTDWKKQAQEEKRRLADEEKRRAADRESAGSASAPPGGGFAATGPATAAAPGASSAAAPGAAAAAKAGREGEPRQAPPASFSTLVNSLLTQVLIYLGDVTLRGSEPMINLDTAKHLIDTLSVLEEKTKGNLNPEEQKILDRALYETRMRYVAVASQYVNP